MHNQWRPDELDVWSGIQIMVYTLSTSCHHEWIGQIIYKCTEIFQCSVICPSPTSSDPLKIVRSVYETLSAASCSHILQVT